MDPRSPESLPPAPPPAPPERKSGWAFFGVLVLLAFAGFVAQASSRLLGFVWTETFALLAPAVVAAAGSNLRPAAYLRLGPARPAAIAIGLAGGAAGFLVAGAVMAVTMRLLPESWVRAFDVSRLLGPPGWRSWAFALIASLLAPVCEEIVFRGYLQTTFGLSRPARAAIALAALLFAAIHLDPVRFPALVLLGALYGWLAWRAGSVWPAVAAHAANNAVASLVFHVRGEAAAPPPAPVAGAGLLLALGLGALLPLLAAYRAVTPAPPPVETALRRRDPSQPSIRFSLAQVPPRHVALWLAGVATLVALVLGAALR
ncbi:MAG TPA: CPBP family intramembrane glutamic endopeptidase [Anaeromyxobacteraceae bacterium]|nr:CPBP family intramembrane glutamic endopeptidase [Anaeromyxobacteraceae bacterium]